MREIPYTWEEEFANVGMPSFLFNMMGGRRRRERWGREAIVSVV